MASLSMLQRPRPLSSKYSTCRFPPAKFAISRAHAVAPNQYDFWEDDKTGCVGSDATVQTQRKLGSALEMLPSLYDLQDCVPQASLLQSYLQTQAEHVADNSPAGVHGSDFCPALSLEPGEIAAIEGAGVPKGGCAPDICLAALSLAAALPELPRSAAHASQAKLQPLYDSSKAGALGHIPPGERPHFRPRHSLPRALVAAALNTVGLQSQHFSLLDHNPPPFALASTGLPGSHRANEGALARRNIASLDTEYAEWGQSLSHSGALGMALTVHTGAMLQKWYPRDGLSASELGESTIPSEWTGLQAALHVPHVLSVPLAIRILGWVMACPWVTWDVPRGTFTPQLQWLGLQSLHHGVQKQMLLRFMRWRQKSLSRYLPDFLAPSNRSKLEHPLSASDLKVSSQQILLPVQMNKAVRKAMSASDLEEAFQVCSELMRAAYALLGAAGDGSSSAGTASDAVEAEQHILWVRGVIQAALAGRSNGATTSALIAPLHFSEHLQPQAAGSAVANFHAKRQAWSLGQGVRQFAEKAVVLQQAAADEFDGASVAEPPVDFMQCIVAIGKARKIQAAGKAPQEAVSSGPAIPKALIPTSMSRDDDGSSDGSSQRDGSDDGDESDSGPDSVHTSGSASDGSDSEEDAKLGDGDMSGLPRSCDNPSQWLMAYCVCTLCAAFGVVSRKEVLLLYATVKPTMSRLLSLSTKHKKSHLVLLDLISGRVVGGLEVMSRRAVQSYHKRLVEGSRHPLRALKTRAGGAFLRIYSAPSPVLNHSVKQLISAPTSRLANSRSQAVHSLIQCALSSLQKGVLFPPQALPWVDESSSSGRVSDCFGPGAGQALRSFMMITPGAWLMSASTTEAPQAANSNRAAIGNDDDGASHDGAALEFALEAAADESGDSLHRMLSHICQSASGCSHHEHGYSLKLHGGDAVDEATWRATFQAFVSEAPEAERRRSRGGVKRRRSVTPGNGTEATDADPSKLDSTKPVAARPLALPFGDSFHGNALGADEGTLSRPASMARAATLHLALACQVAADAGIHLPEQHSEFKLPSAVLSRIPILTDGALPQLRLKEMLPVPQAAVSCRSALGNMFIGEYLHCFGIPFISLSVSFGSINTAHVCTLLQNPEARLQEHPEVLDWILAHNDTRVCLKRLETMGVISFNEAELSDSTGMADNITLATTISAASAWVLPVLPKSLAPQLPLCSMAYIVRFWRDIQGLGYVVRGSAQFASSGRAYASSYGPPVPIYLLPQDVTVADCMGQFDHVFELGSKGVRRQRASRVRSQPTSQQKSKRDREERRAAIKQLGGAVASVGVPRVPYVDVSGLSMLSRPALDDALRMVVERFSHCGIAPYPMGLEQQETDLDILVPTQSRLQVLCNRHVLSPFLEEAEAAKVREHASSLVGAGRTYCISKDRSEQKLKLVPLALNWPPSDVGSSLPTLASLWDLLPVEDQEKLESDPDRWPVQVSQLQSIDVCSKTLENRWGLDFRTLMDAIITPLHDGDFRNLISNLPNWALTCVSGPPVQHSPDPEALKRLLQMDQVQLHEAFTCGKQLFPVCASRLRLDSLEPQGTQLSAIFALLEPDVCVWLRSPRTLPAMDAIRTALLQGIWLWKCKRVSRMAPQRRAVRRRNILQSPNAKAIEDAADSYSSQDEAAALRRVQVSTLLSRVDFNISPSLPSKFVSVPGPGPNGTVRKQLAGLDPERLLVNYIDGMQTDSNRRGSQALSKRILPKDLQAITSFRPLQGVLPWRHSGFSLIRDEQNTPTKQPAVGIYAEVCRGRFVEGGLPADTALVKKLFALQPDTRRIWSARELCCLLNPFVDWQRIADGCDGTFSGSVRQLTAAEALDNLVGSVHRSLAELPLSQEEITFRVVSAARYTLSLGGPVLPWSAFFTTPAESATQSSDLLRLLKWDASSLCKNTQARPLAEESAPSLDLSSIMTLEVEALHVKLQQLAAMGSGPATEQAMAYWGKTRLEALVAAEDFPMAASLGVVASDSSSDLASREHFTVPLLKAEKRMEILKAQQELVQCTLHGGTFPVDAHRMLTSECREPKALADSGIGGDGMASSLQARWVLQLTYDKWKHAMFGQREALRSNAVDTAMAVLGVDVGSSCFGGGAYSGLHEVLQPGSCGSFVIKKQLEDMVGIGDSLEAWQQATLARAVLLTGGPLTFCPHCSTVPGSGRGFSKCGCHTGILFAQIARINKACLLGFTTSDAYTSAAIAVLASSVAHDVMFAQNTDNLHLQVSTGYSRFFTQECASMLASGLAVSGPAKVGTITFATAKTRSAELLRVLSSVLDCAMSELAVLDDGHIDSLLRGVAAAKATPAVKAVLPRLDQMLGQLRRDLAALPGGSEEGSAPMVAKSSTAVVSYLVECLGRVQAHISSSLQESQGLLESEEPEEDSAPTESQLAELVPVSAVGQDVLREEALGARAQALAACNGHFAWHSQPQPSEKSTSVLSLPLQASQESKKRGRDTRDGSSEGVESELDVSAIVAELWQARTAQESSAGHAAAAAGEVHVLQELLLEVVSNITGRGWDANATAPQLLPLQITTAAAGLHPCDLDLKQAGLLVQRCSARLSKTRPGTISTLNMHAGALKHSQTLAGGQQLSLDAAEAIAVAVLCVLSQPSQSVAVAAVKAHQSGSMLTMVACALSPASVVWPKDTAAAAPVAAVLAADCMRWVAQPRAWLYASGPFGTARQVLYPAAADSQEGISAISPHLAYPGAMRCRVVALEMPAPRPVWPWVTPDGNIEHAARRIWERAIVSIVMSNGSLSGLQLHRAVPQLSPAAVLWHVQHLQQAGCLVVQFPDEPGALPAVALCSELLQQASITASPHAVALYIRHEFAPELLRCVSRLAPVRWRKAGPANPVRR